MSTLIASISALKWSIFFYTCTSNCYNISTQRKKWERIRQNSILKQSLLSASNQNKRSRRASYRSRKSFGALLFLMSGEAALFLLKHFTRVNLKILSHNLHVAQVSMNKMHLSTHNHPKRHGLREWKGWGGGGEERIVSSENVVSIHRQFDVLQFVAPVRRLWRQSSHGIISDHFRWGPRFWLRDVKRLAMVALTILLTGNMTNQ